MVVWSGLGLTLLPVACEISVPCGGAGPALEATEQVIDQTRGRTHGRVEQTVRLKKLTAGLKPSPDFFKRSVAADLCGEPLSQAHV
jgi:hypothetical protein